MIRGTHSLVFAKRRESRRGWRTKIRKLFKGKACVYCALAAMEKTSMSEFGVVTGPQAIADRDGERVASGKFIIRFS